MKQVVVVILCYLIGAIPFSYIVPRVMGGLDIRRHGSGNVGATNVLRTLGPKHAALAFAGDVLKGFLAVWLASMVGGDTFVAICAVVVVAAHCYPVFLGFQGGKGAATSAGVLFFITPKAALALLVIFAVVLLIFRFVSLSSIVGAVTAPVTVFLIYGYNTPILLAVLVLALIILFKHKANIERLRKGTEPRIGENK